MDMIEEIKKLKALLDQGAITEEEFSTLKKELMSKKTNSDDSQKEAPDSKKEAATDSSLKLGYSKEEATKMLDKKGIDIDSQGLIYYAEIGNYKTTELLLIAGVDPNESWLNPQQNRNIYPLHNTVGWGTRKMILLLLSYDADINLGDDEGFTPLFYAIEHGTKAKIKVLIEGGADLNHKNKKNINPVYYAKKQKKPEMLEFLLKSGADDLPADEKRAIESKSLGKVFLVAAAVLVLVFFVGRAINNSSGNLSATPKAKESTSTNNSASHLRTCSKHHVKYDPDAYGGRCNKCVDEDNAAAIEKARKKFNTL